VLEFEIGDRDLWISEGAPHGSTQLTEVKWGGYTVEEGAIECWFLI
jgi:hypothetical protein